MVTTCLLTAFVQPFVLASLTQAIRLHALLEPKNRPSCLTRNLDMATASASVILMTGLVVNHLSMNELIQQSAPKCIVHNRHCKVNIMSHAIVASGNRGEWETTARGFAGGLSHALNNCVDLVSPLCSFAFFSVEHHTMFDLYIWGWFSSEHIHGVIRVCIQ